MIVRSFLSVLVLVIMAGSAFILGNYCEVSEATERAEEGDYAVVQSVNNTMANNKGVLWIMKDKASAVQLSKALHSAVAAALFHACIGRNRNNFPARTTR